MFFLHSYQGSSQHIQKTIHCLAIAIHINAVEDGGNLCRGTGNQFAAVKNPTDHGEKLGLVHPLNGIPSGKLT